MAERWLGREFEVHGGGRDLIFPHHENEIALTQAQAAAETLRNRLREGTGGTDDALREAVQEALDDDFNTPRALALLFDAPPSASGTVAEVLCVLGLGVLAHEEQAPPELVEQ